MLRASATLILVDLYFKSSQVARNLYTHTHTHTHVCMSVHVCVCEREREYRAAVEVDMAFLAWEDDFCLAISCQKFSKLTFLVSSLPPFGRNRGLQPLRPESPQLPPRHHDFAVLQNLGGP